jgi:AraC family transcriptional regulator
MNHALRRPRARPVASGHLVLPYGQFYGRFQAMRHVAGFELAVLDADPTRHVERHSHEEAHFVLLLDGLYRSTALGAPALSVGPTLVYNPPGTTHRDRFEPREGGVAGRFFTLSVAAHRLGTAELHSPLLGAATCLSPREGVAIARRIVVECARWDRCSPLAAEGLALELLALVSRRRQSDETRAPGWVVAARELLLDRLDDDLRIDEVARAARVHPVHLARVFRRVYGRTPGDFVRHHRLERAASLLRETRRPISEVALSSGFADQSHLSHAFKRRFGVTPGAYRRGGAATSRPLPARRTAPRGAS